MVLADNAQEADVASALRPESAEFVPQASIQSSKCTQEVVSRPVYYPHPLHKKWTFWALLTKNKTAKQVKVGQVATVEEFWSLQNSIQTPSHSRALSYSLFKGDLDPANERTCQDGGRWIAQFGFDNIKGPVLDEMWLTTMLALIGEEIHDGGEYVAGATVSIRASYHMITLWVDKSSHAVSLGKQFHRLLRKVASDANIALGDFHFEDFSQGMFTYVIRAMVAPVLEDENAEGLTNSEDASEHSFGGLGTPADPSDSESEEGKPMTILSALQQT